LFKVIYTKQGVIKYIKALNIHTDKATKTDINLWKIWIQSRPKEKYLAGKAVYTCIEYVGVLSMRNKGLSERKEW